MTVKYLNYYLSILLTFGNMLNYYVFKYFGVSKNLASFIAFLITMMIFFAFGKVWTFERNKNINLNNYSLLGVVKTIQKCHGYRTDYYSAETIYLTQVEGRRFHDFHIPWYDYDTKVKIQIGDTILFRKYFNEYDCQVISWHPSPDTLQLFQKPVKYLDGKEIGNDYYYYAKLRPDLSFMNFGLNKLILDNDNILYYKNINDSIDNQIHRCSDSFQTQANRNMLDTALAFYFHSEIIPAEQVFSEIPQAKEYYEKYK